MSSGSMGSAVKYCFLLLCLLGFSTPLLFAGKIDSLTSELASAGQDTGRLSLQLALAKAHGPTSADTAISFANDGIALAESLVETDWLGKFYLQKGFIYQKTRQFDSAEVNLNKAVALFKKSGNRRYEGTAWDELMYTAYGNEQFDKALAAAAQSEVVYTQLGEMDRVAATHNAMGVMNKIVGDYEQSLDHYLQALKIYDETGDKERAATTRSNVGNLYRTQDLNQEAREYLLEAEAFYRSEPGYERDLAKVYTNIGLAYKNDEDYGQTRQYFLKSESLFVSLRDSFGMMAVYSNLGELEMTEENLDVAKTYLEKAYKIGRARGEKLMLNYPLGHLSALHLKRGEYARALDYSRQQLEIVRAAGANPEIVSGLKTIAEIYRKMGRFEEALDAQTEMLALKDSIFQEEKTLVSIQMEAEFRNERMQKKNELLEKDKLLGAAELSASRNRSLMLVAVLVLLIVIAGFLYRNIRRQNRMNSLLVDRNDKIMAQKARLEQLNEEKSKWVRVVAHDLKAPLNQIEALSSLIAMDAQNLNPEQEQYLRLINKSSSRLSELIASILSSQTIEQGEQENQQELLDLKNIVEDIALEFEVLASKKQLELHAQIPNLPCNIQGDKNYVNQIIQNLLSNAIKFSPPGKRIFLHLDPGTNGHVKISIRDEGPGIHPADKGKLFKKEQSLRARPTGGESSTGLGLSIVKEYTEAMNGKVWCESEYGQGATFLLEFPKA